MIVFFSQLSSTILDGIAACVLYYGASWLMLCMIFVASSFLFSLPSSSFRIRQSLAAIVYVLRLS